MDEKITTQEEYEQCLIEKKKYKNDFFELELEMFKNKKNQEKLDLLMEKKRILKSKYAKVTLKIKKDYNEKKEGKKK